jgi:hypothetical protein
MAKRFGPPWRLLYSASEASECTLKKLDEPFVVQRKKPLTNCELVEGIFSSNERPGWPHIIGV